MGSGAEKERNTKEKAISQQKGSLGNIYNKSIAPDIANKGARRDSILPVTNIGPKGRRIIIETVESKVKSELLI
jgi:hypothetical protein